MASKLKPCPFCGGEAVLEVFGAFGEVRVRCVVCGTVLANRRTAESEMVAAWNRMGVSKTDTTTKKSLEVGEVAVAESATTTGNAAKCRALLTRLRDAYREDEDGVPFFDGTKVTNLKSEIDAALALLPKDGESVNKPTTDDTGVNSAKMREALESIRNLAYEVEDMRAEDMNCEGVPRTALPVRWVIDTVKEALAAPPKPQGNVAKLREALLSLRTEFEAMTGFTVGKHYHFNPYRIVEKIDDALKETEDCND